jgi:subtilase family serine protease
MRRASMIALTIGALLAGGVQVSIQAAKPLPDLTVSSLTAPASAAPGETLSLIYTVRNAGTGQASPSTLGCALAHPLGTMSLGTVPIPRLKPGAQSTSALSVTIPSSVAPGSYTLTLTADIGQSLQESNEANNARSVPLQILSAGPGEALLSWNPNPEPDIAGYRTHYGTASRDYREHMDVGNVTSATVSPLASGLTYYFAVTAYNHEGLESDFSNEGTKRIP